MEFVNLQAESGFSFLHGTFRPHQLVERAQGLGQRTVGLTDRWSLHGMAEFLTACRRADIIPLLGARIMVNDGSWVTLYPLSRKGFQNLTRLVTLGLGKEGAALPYVTLSELEDHSQELVALVGGPPSRLRRAASLGLDGEVEQELRWWKERFHGRLYVALCLNRPEDRRANGLLHHLCSRLEIPLVISHPVIYLRTGEKWVHQLLVGIARRHHHRPVLPMVGRGFRPIAAQEAERAVPLPQAIRETAWLAERLSQFRMDIGQRAVRRNLVAYGGEGGVAELWREALHRLARLHSPSPPAYILRLAQEMALVEEKGIAPIFLIMARVKEFARRRGIASSIRGSAGGSLLVHLLMGGPDPVAHGLLFQRFINGGRMDMPDIDMDFDSQRRDEVTRWLLEQEPHRAALVATIQTFRARSSVRLAARAMGYPLQRINELTTCLPWSLRGIPLSQALHRLPELKASPLRGEKALVRAAERIEGLPYQASVHLGGVILAPDHLSFWSPCTSSRKGFRVSQLDKDAVEALGLLKIDLLGLRMHTALENARRYVLELRGQPPPRPVPKEDEAALRLIRSGDTVGLFQLESPGQRNLVLRLLPRRFQDVVAEISLFRPGPMKSDMVERYLRRRSGLEPVDHLHPSLASILGETYGVIVFQEQVLEIVHGFAGFSYDDADAFRRAMTKNRSPQEMERLRSAFMAGARRQGHPQELAREVFRRLAAFAAYGFCKAHAVAFAEITMESAFLKAHYPLEFYLGLLNAGQVGSYPPWVILNEARRRGIPILRPHVNASSALYLPEGGGIRLPLTTIHGIGAATARAIVEERRRNGPYSCASELLRRTNLAAGVVDRLRAAGAVASDQGREAA